MKNEVTIFYNDTHDSVNRLFCRIQKQDDDYIHAQTQKGKVKIPRNRVVRIEEGRQ